MWSIFKYIIDSPDTENQESTQSNDEVIKKIKSVGTNKALRKSLAKRQMVHKCLL